MSSSAASSSLRVVVVVGNPSRPSRTKVLAESALQALGQRRSFDSQVIELADIGTTLGASLSRTGLPAHAQDALAAIEQADLLIVASPVYKGSYTGLFKHLFDLVGYEDLIGKPVLLLATGGSDRHALVIDHQLRPLFGFFRAATVPTGVYASEGDFSGYELTSPAVIARLEGAADEAAVLLDVAAARKALADAQRPALAAAA